MASLKKLLILFIITVITFTNCYVAFGDKLVNKGTTLEIIKAGFEHSEAYGKYKINAASIKVLKQLIKLKAIEVNKSKATNDVLGFATYYYDGDKSSLSSLTKNYSLINILVTHTYEADGLGNIRLIYPVTQAPISYINFAKQKGIKVLAMVTNRFDGNISKELLESQGNRKRAIDNLVMLLKQNNYDGVNVDFEGVYYYNRMDYTNFIKEMYEVLHAQNLLLTLSVPAKVTDRLTDSWNGAFDYRELAKYSDKIVIMTYDEHYPGGNPGPVASYGWVRKVADYSVSVIPREKIIFGAAAYGYDWGLGKTKAYGINGINNLAVKYSAEIKWDSTSQTPYFSYTDEAGISHEVWYENEKSLGYKIDIIKDYRLAGIGIWRLGLENDSFWAVIRDKLLK